MEEFLAYNQVIQIYELIWQNRGYFKSKLSHLQNKRFFNKWST
jgi:hypothetical protein